MTEQREDDQHIQSVKREEARAQERHSFNSTPDQGGELGNVTNAVTDPSGASDADVVEEQTETVRTEETVSTGDSSPADEPASSDSSSSDSSSSEA